MPGTTLSKDEILLAKRWAVQDGVPPSEIADRLDRDKSTITRLLKPTSRRAARGRKVVTLRERTYTLPGVANANTHMCVCLCRVTCVAAHTVGVWLQKAWCLLFVRQAALTKLQVDALVSKLKELVKKADAKYEVTVAMLKRSTRCKARFCRWFVCGCPVSSGSGRRRLSFEQSIWVPRQNWIGPEALTL